MAIQVGKNCFYWTWLFIIVSVKPSTFPYSQPDKFTSYIPIQYMKTIFNIIVFRTLRSSNWLAK